MIGIATALLSQLPSAAWSAAGATAVLFIQTFIPPSKHEKHQSHREDFKAITDSLYKDIEALRDDVENYKNNAAQCEDRYNDLQERFLDFKAKYNELELRYQVQVQINRKISEEIKRLEDQVALHLEQSKLQAKNDEQEPTLNTLKAATGR